jgi:hypothetical protein
VQKITGNYSKTIWPRQYWGTPPRTFQYYRATKLRYELTTLRLVSSYCRLHLLYATEALYVTQMRSLQVVKYSLQHTWQCAVSHIFNVSGANVNFICSQTDKCSLDE